MPDHDRRVPSLGLERIAGDYLREIEVVFVLMLRPRGRASVKRCLANHIALRELIA